MELNLIGALTMFKTMDMVPNFSELARTFGRIRSYIRAKHFLSVRLPVMH